MECVVRDHRVGEVERHVTPGGLDLQPPGYRPPVAAHGRTALLLDPDDVLDLAGRVRRKVRRQPGQLPQGAGGQGGLQSLIKFLRGQPAVPRRDTQQVHDPVPVRMRGPQPDRCAPVTPRQLTRHTLTPIPDAELKLYRVTPNAQPRTLRSPLMPLS